MLTFFEESQTNWTSIVLIVVLIVAFIALIWFSNYSQKKKQKQAAEMNNSIKVGDRVKSIGGIIGTIVAIDEENGNFEIQTGTTTMVLDRNAVYPIAYYDAQNARPAAQAKAEEPAVEPAKEEAPVVEPAKEEAPAEEKPESKEE